MYKVDYYTLAIINGKDIGNIKQFDNIWYTEHEISVLEKELQRAVDIKYGDNKYKSIVKTIEAIKGHL